MSQERNGWVDLLDVSHSKLSFISDAFSQDTLKDFRFSEQGLFGFYNIITDIETELEFVMHEMSQKEVQS